MDDLKAKKTELAMHRTSAGQELARLDVQPWALEQVIITGAIPVEIPDMAYAVDYHALGGAFEQKK